ncbi:TadE/TadG family type IV pilus assembly protein [Cryptosporangium phraense]|uniref:Pilus assembly protein n=1 Tax=Cryptosporangium phraense TaxID=2593070 RepID=A0A545AN58_9ACTN|nr:TadE/TadG family type IV pilus assembly protein [Cryptosporangium phraense]TQS42767.1 pilus assembly protein [Cryptosporangium phraense]
MRRRLRSEDSDAGSISVELTLLTPLLVLLVLFVVAAGRLADAQARVDQATYSAARAASLSRDPAIAARAARSTATGALDRPAACASLNVDVDATAFVPGGTVTVQVTCVVSLADLTGLGLPGNRTLSSTSTSPLDRFRAVTR